MLINNHGTLQSKLASVIKPNPELVIPDGWMVSWKNQFYKVPITLQRPAVFTHGTAKIFVTVVIDSLVIRIESPKVSDLAEAINLVVLYVGGNVATFTPNNAECSFIKGIMNDLRHLKQIVQNSLRKSASKLNLKLLHNPQRENPSFVSGFSHA